MRKLLIQMVLGSAALFTVTVGTSHAQSIGNVIEPKSTSPFEIAKAINKGRRMWGKQSIHVDVDLAATWRTLGVDAGNFECAGNCTAKIYRADLDPAYGQEVILKLTQSFDFCRYLIFARARSQSPAKHQWTLRGYIDHDFNRYQMASHRVIHVLGKNWLVIRGQQGSGSGYSLYGETWYKVGDKGISAVLNYPVEGHVYPWPIGLGREFKADVTVHPSSKANDVLVRYRVAYTTLDYIKDSFSRLFVNQHSLYFNWSNSRQAFIFNETRSDISRAEINAIADIDSDFEPEGGTKIGGTTFYTLAEAKALVGGGYEVFLKYNSRRLMKIALGSDVPKKRWLQDLLKDCKDTLEKKALLQALQKQ